jgi:hypothetical protein
VTDLTAGVWTSFFQTLATLSSIVKNFHLPNQKTTWDRGEKEINEKEQVNYNIYSPNLNFNGI